MKHIVWLVIFAAVCTHGTAQEVLLPLFQTEPTSTTKSAKTTTTLSLPFFDDFSNYTGQPNSNLWAPSGATIDNTFAHRPPTIGEATLNALDANGRLYSNDVSTLPFAADTLASLPIRLDTINLIKPRAFTPADSLALSFYYLPGGGNGKMWLRSGDTPEPSDSLILEFYSPTTSSWHHVWATPGLSVDTLIARTGSEWQWVYIPITDTMFLHNGFRFRFRNLASYDNNDQPGRIADCDQWHIDYVFLSHSRHNNPSVRDIAFVTPAPSPLRHYTAMPARQYTPDELRDTLPLCITNLYDETLPLHYSYSVSPNIIPPYDGGNDNIAPYLPSQTYHNSPAHSQPPLTAPIPQPASPTSYTFTHVVSQGVAPDINPSNDTTTFTLHLLDYYAYDDGTAENGYGIYNTSGTVRVAVRFPLNQPDTLTALELTFNHTRLDQNLSIPFLITVWADQNNHPGEILFIDSLARMPQVGTNRYQLPHPLPVDGTIYVGLTQTQIGIINLGIDRNNDASLNTFYNIGTTWQTSILAGALLLRPHFTTSALSPITSTKNILSQPRITAYPNPASKQLNLKNLPQQATLTLLDPKGITILTHTTTSTDHSLLLPSLPPAIYLLQITSPNSPPTTLKIAITQ